MCGLTSRLEKPEFFKRFSKNVTLPPNAGSPVTKHGAVSTHDVKFFLTYVKEVSYQH